MTNDEAHQPFHAANPEAANQRLPVPAWRRVAAKAAIVASMAVPQQPSLAATPRDMAEHWPESSSPLPETTSYIEDDSLARPIVEALREAQTIGEESDRRTDHAIKTAVAYAIESEPRSVEAQNLEFYEQALTDWRRQEAVRLGAEDRAYREINSLRQTLGSLSPRTKERIDQDIESRLARVPSSLIRKKIAAEAMLDRDVSWVDMLAEVESPHSEGYGYDEHELVQFLEWSIIDAEQEAKDPEQRAQQEAARKLYIKELRASIGDGPDDLHPNLAQRTARLLQTKILPNSILNRITAAGNLAYAYPHKNVVVLPQGVSRHVKSHEFTHNVVDFGHTVFNEAVVETATLRIIGQEHDEGAYSHDRKVLQSIMHISGLTLRDITGFNIPDSPVETQHQFADAVYERTGVDIVGFVTDFYDQLYQLRPSRELNGDPALARRNALRPVRQALLIIEFMLPNGRLATTDLQQRVAGVEKVIAGLEKDRDQEMADAARQGLKLCLSSLPTL